MYLKRLELQGFKSFADKTVLEFKPGITSVIGPNGSGKSNISDAIRWVLGEQSMKALRGNKSEDIIFAGTENRKALGYAEVTMVLDNEDEMLKIEYKEVKITRRIYRTGESAYFINKVACRLKDITELFLDTGIGKDAYSIIGQGRIDEILSNKSEDRRRIFEEAAGIVKYRVRREETEKKLEKTKLNLIRINDILQEIEQNISSLKYQAEKAEQFIALKEELKEVEVSLFLYKIEDYKKSLEKLVSDLEIFNSQKDFEMEKLELKQKEREALKQNIEDLQKEFERIQAYSYESKNTIEKINTNISVAEERILNNNENVLKIEKEIKENNEKILSLKDDKENRNQRKIDLDKNKEKFEKELKEKEEELKKINEKLGEKELENEKKKKEIDDLIEEKYNVNTEYTSNVTSKENIEEQIKKLQKDIYKIEKEIDQTYQEKVKKETELKEEKELILESEKEKNLYDEKAKKNLMLEKSIEEKIHNLTIDKREKTAKMNFLIEAEREKEGYKKAVKSIIIATEKNKELGKGINGVLANLIETDKKYSVAIEQALAASMQNIVTDTSEDAKKMIEYLRINNLGRATFMPISDMKENDLKDFKKSEGYIEKAKDLIRCDRKYNKVISNLLGRTIVVDNIENAIKMAKLNAHQFKIVTLEGDVISPSGIMTGGSRQNKSVSILGRDKKIKELEEEIVKIEKEIEKVVLEKEELNSRKDSFDEEYKNVLELYKEKEIQYAKEQEQYNNIEKEYLKKKENKEKLLLEKEENKNLLKEAEEKIIELENKIKEIEKRRTELEKEVAAHKEKDADEIKYLDNLNADITDLKISVSSFNESNFSINELIEKIDEDIKSLENNNKEKEQEKTKKQTQNKELEKDILEYKSKIENIEKTVGESFTTLEAIKKNKNEKIEKQNMLEKETEEQYEKIQTIKSQIVKMDMRKSNIKDDINDVLNKLWNQYELTPNNAKERYVVCDNLKETQERQDELYASIRVLGTVNVGAIEEYKKTKERYELMCTQRLDLENSIAKLRKIITEMTNTMIKIFKEKFIEINKNFDEVFKELFGGGKAKLILEDEDDVLESGIEIEVQPKGKRLQNMNLLSGGEKALTAIAILFAILKINPAPFCILDEIEAALDDVNVYRYADYLKKFSKDTQFLVITHRKGTMEAADVVYGITMEENGVSKLLSMNLSKTL